MAGLKDDWVWIGLGIGAVYLIYKTTKPVTNTLDAVGNAIGEATQSTGSAISEVMETSGHTLSDNIDLLNIKKDVGYLETGLSNIWGYLQGLGSNNSTQVPNQPILTAKPVGNVNFAPNVSNTSKIITSVVAPKTQTLTPLIDSIVQQPLANSYGPRIIASKTPIKIGNFYI